jgi:hypothetical protein
MKRGVEHAVRMADTINAFKMLEESKKKPLGTPRQVGVVVPSGRKRPLVTPLDFLSNRYRVLLPLSRSCFVVSYFPRPCRSGPSIAFCFAWHLRCHASSWSRFFVFRLSILSAVFLFFYCRLSIRTSNLFPMNLTCVLCVRNISICILPLRFLGSASA